MPRHGPPGNPHNLPRRRVVRAPVPARRRVVAAPVRRRRVIK